MAVDAALAPLQPLVDPGDRLYWGYLVGSAVLALAVYLWAARRAERVPSVGGFLRFVLPRKIWLHRSSLLDAQLLALKAIVAALVAVPAGLSAYGLAVAIVTGLDARFGTPAATGWSAATVSVLYTLVLFVVWDFSRYAVHRALHRVPLLWEFHKLHHSAEVLTPLTLYRAHPVESLLMALRGVLVTGVVTGMFFYWFRGQAVQWTVLGVHAGGFVFNTLGGNLRHSHVWLGYGRRLERWLISPAQHQIHHSIDPAHYDRNFGTWLAVWDRLGGSLVTSAGLGGGLRYGLLDAERNHHPHRLGSSLLGPVLAACRRLPPGRAGRGGAAAVPSTPRAVRSATRAFAVLLAVLVPTPGAAQAPAAAAPATAATAPATTTTAPTPATPVEAVPATQVPDEWLRALTTGDRSVVPTVTILGGGSQRAWIAGSAHTVDEQALERHNYDDVHQVLAEVPGVYVREEDGYGLRPNIGLRGASSDRSAKITLMEDGVLLAPAPYAAPAAYYFPLMSRMTQVEVFKGPAAIQYGPNTVGGAINLVTRGIPAQSRGAVDVGYGRFGHARADAWWGTGGDHWGVLLTAARLSSNGFKHIDYSATPDPERPQQGDTGFAKYDTTAKLRVNGDLAANVYHQAELKVGFGTESGNETYLGLTDADFDRDPYARYPASQLDRFDWWRTQAALTYSLSAGQVDVAITAYRNDFYRTWEKVDGFRNGPALGTVLATPSSGQNQVLYAILTGAEDSATSDEALMLGTNERSYVSQGLQASATWRADWGPTRHEWTFSARLHHDEVVRDQRQNAYAMRGGSLVPEGGAAVPTGQNTGAARAGAFYVYDEIRIGDWMLAPGSRVEVVRTAFDDRLAAIGEQVNLDTVWLPGLGVSWQAAEWLTVLAGAHRGFSPVAPGQPAAVDPEISANYEAGVRYQRPTVAAEAIAFVSDYQNLTALCTQSGGCSDAESFRQFNGGEVLVAGLEATWTQRYEWARQSWLEFGGSYTLTRSRFRAGFAARDPLFGTVAEGDELPYVPNHQGVIDLGGGVAGWDLSLSLNYLTAMRDAPGQGAIDPAARIDGHAVLNIATGYRFKDRARAYVTVDNALDQAYITARRPYGARPGAPLIAVGGLEVDF